VEKLGGGGWTKSEVAEAPAAPAQNRHCKTLLEEAANRLIRVLCTSNILIIMTALAVCTRVPIVKAQKRHSVWPRQIFHNVLARSAAVVAKPRDALCLSAVKFQQYNTFTHAPKVI